MTSRLGVAALALAAAMSPAWAGAQPSLPAASSRPGAAPAVQGDLLRLSLADAVKRGLEFNLSAIREDQQRRVASGARLDALSALLPHVSAQVRQSAQVINTAAFGFTGFGDLPNLIGPFSVFDARVAVTAPLFDPSAMAELRARRALSNAAEADYLRVRETVVLAVANVYLQAISDAARLASAETEVATASALVRLVSDQNAAGVVARIDVLRQQVQLEAARVRAIDAENQLAKRKLQLAHAIGLPASQPLELIDNPGFSPAPDLTLDAATALAASHRADLQGARARVEAARAARRAAATAALPTLRLDADLGALGLTANSAEKTYTVAASLHVPLYEGGRTRARTRQADAALKEREAELADLDEGVRFDLRTALLDVKAAAAAVDAAESGQRLAREELTQAEDRFRAGVASTIELVQAQDAVARSTEQYISSVYAHHVAKAELARALGEGESRFLSFIGDTH